MEAIGAKDVRELYSLSSARGQSTRYKLQKFITGVRVVATYRTDIKPEDYQRRAIPIKGIQPMGADQYHFDKDGQNISVQV